MHKVIGITGAARCGKDTVADLLINNMSNGLKMSFATPMKDMLSTGLGLTHEQLYGSDKETVDEAYGVSPRYIMQTLGTEWGRKLINNDIWVNAMRHKLNTTTGIFVIPDVRFENEASLVREHGVLIHVQGNRTRIQETSHESEVGVTINSKDLIMLNSGTLADLESAVDNLLVLI